MENWHLLMTKPTEDERAELNLLNQNFKIFRPLICSYKVRLGKQVSVVEPLFPRYIFIRLNEQFSNWSALRSTRGVSHLVRFNESPAVVPDVVVDKIRSQLDENGTLDKTRGGRGLYAKGDQIEIHAGSFTGLKAIVHAQTSEERVTILLNMLGKAQKLELPLSQVRRI